MNSSGWKKYKLGELAAPGHGMVDGPFGSNLPASDYTASGVPVIRGVNLSLGEERFNDGDFIFVTTETAKRLARSKCLRGDILFTKKGTLGQIGIIPDDSKYEEYILSSNQMKLTVNPELADKMFVYYYLSSKNSIQKIRQDSEHTGVPKINLTYLRGFPVPLPPLETQQKIASILSSLDDKIELNRQMNATLEAMAQALFKEWFVDFRFPGASGEMEESEGMMVPKGWKTKKMGETVEVTDYVANGSFAALKENVTLYDEPNYALYVRTTDGKSDYNGNLKYVDKHSFEFLKKSILYGDEVIVSNVGDVGSVFRPPVWLDQPMTLGSNAIMLKASVFNNYLFMFLKSPLGQYLLGGIVSGSAQPKFNKTDFRNISIVVPEKAVLEDYNSVCSRMTALMNNLKAEIQTLTQLRNGLLPRLMRNDTI